MSESYIKSRASQTAKVLSARHDVDFATAFNMTQRIWEEAKRCILKAAQTTEWRKLSLSEKSYICSTVIKSLLDKRQPAGFLSGERKSII